MTVSFDGVELTFPRIISVRYTIAESEAVLIDGKRDQYAELNSGEEYSIRCITDSTGTISSLKSRIGKKGSFILGNYNLGEFLLVELRNNPDEVYKIHTYYITLRKQTA